MKNVTGYDLAKLYVEPTNRCNIDCRTCMRQGWDTELGKMSDETYERILDSVAQISPRPTIFFGGLGEPLFHPQTIDMVRRVKELGARAELITNGTLLTPERTAELVEKNRELVVRIRIVGPFAQDGRELGARLIEARGV